MVRIGRQKTISLALALTLVALFAAPARPQVGPIQDSPPPPCTETQPAEIVSAWALPPVALLRRMDRHFHRRAHRQENWPPRMHALPAGR